MTRTHDRNYFYKYTSLETAKKILTNKNFRYSSPLIFNDPFDHQIEMQINFSEETFVSEFIREITTILRENDPATFSPKNLMGFLMRRAASQIKPQDIDEFAVEAGKGARLSFRKIPQQLAEINAEITKDIRSKRVLCVSERKDSILMWSHYSQNHTGVVFKLLCVESVDNSLLVAKPVNYVEKIPLYANLINFIKFSTGQTDRLAPIEGSLNIIVCTKCADWSYEKEWRVVIPDYDNTGALYTDFKEDPKIIASSSLRVELV